MTYRSRRCCSLALMSLLLAAPALARDPDQPPNPATAPAESPIRLTEPGTYTNPLGVDLADPDILFHEGTYYLYATSITNLGYYVWTSKDLVNWQQQEEMALARDHNSWGNSNFWAPDAVVRNGKFYLFYNCVGPAPTDGHMTHRICMAVADSPLGPFKETKAPFLETGRAMIDAHVFIDGAGAEDAKGPDGAGKPYLYYSLDHSENVKANGRHQSELYVVPLADDLTAVAGEPSLVFGASQPWEGQFKIEDTWNEAPFVFKHKGNYVLMYSARVFSDPLYAVGYATAKSPLGPWTKAAENPILKLTSKVSGPGHNSVIPSPDGKELFVVYHTHKYPEGGHDRELAIDRLTVTDGPDGMAKLQITGPTRTPQPWPSGAPEMSEAPATRPISPPRRTRRSPRYSNTER